ncbi:putative clathrin assembly protein isoform X1 [Iris pallida]|uniref:Clathrin assembly protein isoform X1 n=1 Tax=Iris pallida TaxID=29817 RepID=A0AAX6GY00_IRIPA|nr:putative clathrin assembly protein isoform X1 [Iris pallida]
MQHIDQRTKCRSDDDCVDLLLSESVTSSPLRYKREHRDESVDVGDPVLSLRGLGKVGVTVLLSIVQKSSSMFMGPRVAREKAKDCRVNSEFMYDADDANTLEETIELEGIPCYPTLDLHQRVLLFHCSKANFVFHEAIFYNRTMIYTFSRIKISKVRSRSTH